MKKVSLLLFLSVLSNLSVAQSSIKFNKTYPLVGVVSHPLSIMLLSDGYMVYGVRRDSVSPYRFKIYTMKIDTLGNLKWEKYYGNNKYDYNYRTSPWGGGGQKSLGVDLLVQVTYLILPIQNLK